MMNERTKLSPVNNMEKEVLLAAKAEKVEMTLNTDSALASGLLIQRLTELYENPIEATVRETVSNAIDAVVKECSGDKPTVKIYSPTTLNPILIIKDNGVGMTYNDLKEIYSKYGASTKIDDLDQIGAYGLGAKAPLAYGNEFTVTSIKDGQKTTIIVAREEMTNFIKIVDSVITDEPSGTTVSIPVDNADIHRFQENIKKYEQIPFDKDIDLYINDKMVEENNYTLITDKVLIHDGKEKVYSRMWINKDNIVDLITNLSISDIKESIKFVIGGWSYESPAGRSRYYRRDNGIVVELKAGIVGFNSSRDAILENERYTALENLVVDYIVSSQFINDLTQTINELELKEFKRVVSELINNNRRYITIENGKIVIKNTTGNNYNSYSTIPRTFDIGDFVHEETGFNFNDVLKNVPKSGKQTVVIRERKDRYYKSAKNAIMDTNFSFYSMFDTRNVSDINEEIDKILIENEVGHSLEVLMTNLATFIFDPKKTKNTKLTFITDIETEKQVKSLKSGRKSIVRMLNGNDELEDYTSILVYTQHSKSEIDKMLKGLEIEDMVGLKVSKVEDILESLKKYRSKYKATAKGRKKQENLSTSLYKYDTTINQIKTVDVNAIDKNKENLIVVTKAHSVENSRLRMMYAWFCNEYELTEDEADIYVSVGMHTAVDIDILTELTEYVMRDPRSDAAGRSKVYFDKIHDNEVKMNAINNNAVNSSEKAFMRLLTGVYRRCATRVAEIIEYKLKTLYDIAEIADFKMPKFPTKTLKSMGDYDFHSFSDMSTYSNWGLDENAITHLLSLIDEDQYELLQNLISFTNDRRLVIDEKGNHKLVYHGAVEPIRKETVSEVYENQNVSTSYSKLVKLQTEAQLEFAKSVIEQMELVEF